MPSLLLQIPRPDLHKPALIKTIRCTGPLPPGMLEGTQMDSQVLTGMLLAMQGDQWKQTTLKTALLFPGIVFGIFLSLNFLVWGQKSSGAVPFGTLFALCFLWFGISVPLVFVGSYFGYKKPAPEDPVRTNKIPRQIPEQVSGCNCCLAAAGAATLA